MKTEVKKIDDLLPDPNNVNRHTQRGHGLVENSIRRRGVGRGRRHVVGMRRVGGGIVGDEIAAIAAGVEIRGHRALRRLRGFPERTRHRDELRQQRHQLVALLARQA